MNVIISYLKDSKPEMRLLICLMLILVSYQFSFFGINKNVATVLDEFAESATNILNTTGYIQLYDVSKQVKILFTSPLVTLYNIEIMDIRTSGPLPSSQLAFSTSGDKATIQLIKGSNFGLKAKVSLKWKYVVGGMMIYQGSYTADLSTVSPSLVFTLTNNSNVFAGDIKFGFNLTNEIVSGFGAANMVKQVVNQMFFELLASPLVAELNRYNDIMMNAVIFNYFYRSILIGYVTDKKEPVYLKNYFAKFIILTFNNSNYITFDYDSAVYFAIRHEEYPIKGNFTPIDSYNNSISLYYGFKGLSDFLEQMTFRINAAGTVYPANQTKVLGFPITTRILSTYYPKLSEDFPVSENTIIITQMKGGKQGVYNNRFNWSFVLESNPKKEVFNIENLQWSTDLDVAFDKKTGQTVNIALSKFRFTKLEMKSPKMPKYMENQFMSLLQPLSRSESSSFSFPMHVVDEKMKWAFVDQKVSEEGDLTLYFKRN
jgi:hypothetical protein